MKSKIYDLYKFNLWFLFARRNCELQNKQKIKCIFYGNTSVGKLIKSCIEIISVAK